MAKGTNPKRPPRNPRIRARARVASEPPGPPIRVDGYTPEIGRQICKLVEEGKTLSQIAALDEMPCWETLRRWIREHDDLRVGYIAAREVSGEAIESMIFEAMQSATDKDSAAVARMRVAALQWIASKRAPKVYGDKLDLNVTTPAQALTDERLNERLAELAAKAKRALPAPAKKPAGKEGR